jgi:GT2 family glycosyltransferase
LTNSHSDDVNWGIVKSRNCMAQPLVSIVIPVFNQSDFTAACLQSIWSSPVQATFEVVVFDNGSTDDTAKLLEAMQLEYPALKVVSAERNLGFSPACNQGAQAANGQFLLFLNNDTEVTSGWLDILLEPFSDPTIGVTGPKLLYPKDELINHCGYVYNRQVGGFYGIYHQFPADHPAVNRRRQFQALLGACILVRAGEFWEVGGFSDFGLEDIDLCLKLRARGLGVLYVPTAVVYHHGSVTLKESLPGTIPATDVLAFNQAWDSQKLHSDDIDFYQRDGVELSYSDDGKIVLKDVVAKSHICLSEGISALSNGDRDTFKAKALQAIDIYPFNGEALSELALFFCQEGDLKGALTYAERFADCDPESAVAQNMLRVIRTALG